MPAEVYLTVEGLEGEATAKGFEGQIVLDSFQLGANNPTSIGAGTGAGAGKVNLSNFTVTKRTDASSVPLFLACCKGDHFPNAEVTIRKAGGEQVEFIKYKFDTVFVEDINWSGGSGDDVPTEVLSLAFGAVEMTYTPQNADGTMGSPIVAKWDQIAVAAG
jgi:type VI secretion system secreted protein Hcp